MKRETIVDAALLVARIALGGTMAAHGAQKIFGIWGGPGMEGFTAMLGGLGFAVPAIWAWAASLAEFAGGLFIVLGILPRVSASLIAATMFVAAVFVHGKNGFFAMNGGFEYPLFVMLIAVSLAIAGSGKLSVFNKL